MRNKLFVVLSLLILASMVLAACAQPTPATVVETVVVEKPGEVQVTEVVKEVKKVITATPEPEASNYSLSCASTSAPTPTSSTRRSRPS